MASLSSIGIGSGLDIDSMVTQLVAAEGSARGARLASREAIFQAKLSAFGSFRSALDKLSAALDPLKDMTKFQGRAITVGDDKILTAIASTSVAPGTYDVEVERLATSQRLTSIGYSGADAIIGAGTLQLSVGGKAFSVVIDSESTTLSGIRNAINSAAGNTGVVASIVNETGVGARLVLSSTQTGAANTIQVTQSPGGGLQALIDGLAQTQAGQDSRIVVNGLAHESATNSVTTAVDGITFNLRKVSETDVTTPVGVTFDKTAASKAVNDFVSAYNSLVTSLKGLSGYDSKTGASGALFGDNTLRDFLAGVRRELGVPVTGLSGSFSTLSDIGVSGNLDGTLTVNASRLDAMLASSFDQVGGLFANQKSANAPVEGLARRLDTMIENYIGANGFIQARTDGLQSSIDVIDEQREVLNQRLAAMEKRLRAQFTAMDTLVAQLNSTSNFLTQQMSALNGSSVRR